jgi:hypothetical protein
MAFFCFSEGRPISIFTAGNESSPHLVVAVIFDDQHTVQPMFDMITFHNDAGCVELIFFERLLLAGRDQVV